MTIADKLKELGFTTINESFYSKVQEWKSWHEGDVKGFHRYKIRNGSGIVRCKRYVSNVKRIRETFPFVPDLPEAPSDMQSFTFQEANNLEKILVQVESMFQWMDKSYLMAGEAMCGEF